MNKPMREEGYEKEGTVGLHRNHVKATQYWLTWDPKDPPLMPPSARRAKIKALVLFYFPCSNCLNTPTSFYEAMSCLRVQAVTY